MNEVVPRKQNIRTARSFGVEVETYEALKEAVGTFAVNCATKLRKEGSCCTTVTAFVHTNPFKPNAFQYNNSRTLKLAYTSDNIEIVAAAIRLLKEIYRPLRLQKAGVTVGGIVPDTQVQLAFSILSTGRVVKT